MARSASRRPRKSLLVAVLAGLAVGLTAAPAPAKEGVEATLATPVPLDAAPGEKITVAWTLESIDDEGNRQPFGASGIYLRLFSAAAGEPMVGPATGGNGRYEAAVVVPEGGIGGVQIGLVGWVSDPTGTYRSDAFFPITNNPLPDVTDTTPAVLSEPEQAAPAPPPEISGTVSPLRIALFGLALVVAVAALVALLRHRRHPAAA